MRKIDIGDCHFNNDTLIAKVSVTVTYEDGKQTTFDWLLEPANPNLANITESQEQERVMKLLKFTDPVTDEEWKYFKNQFNKETK